MNNKIFFHYLSYLQYPFLLGSLKFYMTFMKSLFNRNIEWGQINEALVFIGIAISFASLQDTKKISLKFEKKIWKNPRIGKIVIRISMVLTLLILMFGIFGYYITENENIKEVSFGIIVLGIGLIGLTKTGIEVFENHRKDKELEKI